MTIDRHAVCAEAVNGFSGQASDDCLALDKVLSEATGLPARPELDDAIFNLLERFPGEDGYGVYWRIIHGLEERGGYEQALLQSVQRKPVFFNVLMLTRMMNAGLRLCSGVLIARLLHVVAASAADDDVRQDAADCLARYEQGSRRLFP